MKNKLAVFSKLPGSCGLCCTKIEDFTVRYGDAYALEHVNLHIHCGELTAIIGPNGAGKSTLLKSILGEIKHEGHMKFLDAKGQRTGKPLMGYVPQYLKFDGSSPISVYDLFSSIRLGNPAWLVQSSKIKKKIIEDLSLVNAEHLIDRKLGSLSGGELQRILLALAIDPLPDLLLLDEPVSGIDQAGLEMFYAMVSNLRLTYDMSIILVSHDLEMVKKFADRVVLLDKKVHYAGPPKELFDSPLIYEVFGLKVGGGVR